MTAREKAAVGVCALAVGAFAAYIGIVRPRADRVETLRRVLPQREQELSEVQAMAAEIAAIRKELETLKQLAQPLETTDQDFALMTHLEKIQRESGLEGRVNMVDRTVPLDEQYDERVVDMRMEGVTLADVERFLNKIESSQAPLRTTEMAIRRDARRPNVLNATAQVRMLAPAPER